jgi:hypothetical protein
MVAQLFAQVECFGESHAIDFTQRWFFLTCDIAYKC